MRMRSDCSQSVVILQSCLWVLLMFVAMAGSISGFHKLIQSHD